MENTNELDKLLGDDGSGSTTVTPAEKDQVLEGDEKAKQAYLKTIKALRDENRSLNSKLEERLGKIEEVVKPLQPHVQEPAVNTLDTQEDWKQYIETKSNEAASKSSSEVEKLKQTFFRKAISKLSATHKEYDPSTEEGKVKLSKALDLAKKIGISDEFDSDAIYTSLEKAWVVDNHSSLIERANRAEQYEQEFHSNIQDLATSGASAPVRQESASVQASKSDVGAYREYQKAGGTSSLEDFLRMM